MNRNLAEFFQFFAFGLSLMCVALATMDIAYGSEYADAPIWLVLCAIYNLLIVIILEKWKKGDE